MISNDWSSAIASRRGFRRATISAARRRRGAHALVHPEPAGLDDGRSAGQRVDEHEQHEHGRRAVAEASRQERCVFVSTDAAPTSRGPRWARAGAALRARFALATCRPWRRVRTGRPARIAPALATTDDTAVRSLPAAGSCTCSAVHRHRRVRRPRIAAVDAGRDARRPRPRSRPARPSGRRADGDETPHRQARGCVESSGQ